MREVWDDEQRAAFVETVAGHLLGGVTGDVLERAFEYWKRVDADCGKQIEELVRAGGPNDNPGGQPDAVGDARIVGVTAGAQRARRARRRRDRALEPPCGCHARARHRRRRVLPSPRRASRLLPRSTRPLRSRSAATRRSAGRGGPFGSDRTVDASLVLTQLGE